MQQQGWTVRLPQKQSPISGKVVTILSQEYTAVLSEHNLHRLHDIDMHQQREQAYYSSLLQLKAIVEQEILNDMTPSLKEIKFSFSQPSSPHQALPTVLARVGLDPLDRFYVLERLSSCISHWGSEWVSCMLESASCKNLLWVLYRLLSSKMENLANARGGGEVAHDALDEDLMGDVESMGDISSESEAETAIETESETEMANNGDEELEKKANTREKTSKNITEEMVREKIEFLENYYEMRPKIVLVLHSCSPANASPLICELATIRKKLNLDVFLVLGVSLSSSLFEASLTIEANDRAQLCRYNLVDSLRVENALLSHYSSLDVAPYFVAAVETEELVEENEEREGLEVVLEDEREISEGEGSELSLGRVLFSANTLSRLHKYFMDQDTCINNLVRNLVFALFTYFSSEFSGVFSFASNSNRSLHEILKLAYKKKITRAVAKERMIAELLENINISKILPSHIKMLSKLSSSPKLGRVWNSRQENLDLPKVQELLSRSLLVSFFEKAIRSMALNLCRLFVVVSKQLQQQDLALTPALSILQDLDNYIKGELEGEDSRELGLIYHSANIVRTVAQDKDWRKYLFGELRIMRAATEWYGSFFDEVNPVDETGNFKRAENLTELFLFFDQLEEFFDDNSNNDIPLPLPPKIMGEEREERREVANIPKGVSTRMDARRQRNLGAIQTILDGKKEAEKGEVEKREKGKNLMQKSLLTLLRVLLMPGILTEIEKVRSIFFPSLEVSQSLFARNDVRNGSQFMRALCGQHVMPARQKSLLSGVSEICERFRRHFSIKGGEERRGEVGEIGEELKKRMDLFLHQEIQRKRLNCIKIKNNVTRQDNISPKSFEILISPYINFSCDCCGSQRLGETARDVRRDAVKEERNIENLMLLYRLVDMAEVYIDMYDLFLSFCIKKDISSPANQEGRKGEEKRDVSHTLYEFVVALYGLRLMCIVNVSTSGDGAHKRKHSATVTAPSDAKNFLRDNWSGVYIKKIDFHKYFNPPL